jgi:RNase H-fold protein (predicted Holliday junction resolvase)
MQIKTGFKVIFQDEAVTSKQAVSELISRGKAYVKEDIDALAAAYILEDYLAAYGEPQA